MDFIGPTHKLEHTQMMPLKFFVHFIAMLIPVWYHVEPWHMLSFLLVQSFALVVLLLSGMSVGVCLQLLGTSSTPLLKLSRITLLYPASSFLCWHSYPSSCISCHSTQTCSGPICLFPATLCSGRASTWLCLQPQFQPSVPFRV